MSGCLEWHCGQWPGRWLSGEEEEESQRRYCCGEPWKGCRLCIEASFWSVNSECVLRGGGVLLGNHCCSAAVESHPTSGSKCLWWNGQDIAGLGRDYCEKNDWPSEQRSCSITPCHVLYHYRIDEQFGWMYGRI